MCRELDFDLVLTGHQHMRVDGVHFGNSFAVQPPIARRIAAASPSPWRTTAANALRAASSPPTAGRWKAPTICSCRWKSACRRGLDTPAGSPRPAAGERGSPESRGKRKLSREFHQYRAARSLRRGRSLPAPCPTSSKACRPKSPSATWFLPTSTPIPSSCWK